LASELFKFSNQYADTIAMPRRVKRDPALDIAPAIVGLALMGLAVFHFLPTIYITLIVGILVAAGVVIAFTFHRKQFPASTHPNHKTDDVVDAARSFAEPVVEPAKPDGLLERLRNVDWFQFEQIVALAYEQSGYRVDRRGGANPDGGIDIILTDSTGQRTAVQCKQWKTWRVGVKTIREFVGALKIAGISKGIFITLQGYTDDARKTAETNAIELVDEQGLARLLEASNARFNPEILRLLDDERKICPKCEQEMVLRTAAKGPTPGSKFWGCSTYPRCRFTMPFA
jgi:hypothetical protein